MARNKGGESDTLLGLVSFVKIFNSLTDSMIDCSGLTLNLEVTITQQSAAASWGDISLAKLSSGQWHYPAPPCSWLQFLMKRNISAWHSIIIITITTHDRVFHLEDLL